MCPGPVRRTLIVAVLSSFAVFPVQAETPQGSLEPCASGSTSDATSVAGAGELCGKIGSRLPRTEPSVDPENLDEGSGTVGNGATGGNGGPILCMW